MQEALRKTNSMEERKNEDEKMAGNSLALVLVFSNGAVPTLANENGIAKGYPSGPMPAASGRMKPACASTW